MLAELHKQPLRFSELTKLLPEISTKSLGRVLHGLEQDAIVKRTVGYTRPPAVTYSLLNNDKLLRQIILFMDQWGARKLKAEQLAGHHKPSRPKKKS